MNVYADDRQFNKGRPSLPSELKRQNMGFYLPPYVRDKIKEGVADYGSQANVIIAAIHALYPDLQPPTVQLPMPPSRTFASHLLPRTKPPLPSPPLPSLALPSFAVQPNVAIVTKPLPLPPWHVAKQQPQSQPQSQPQQNGGNAA
jgi:hypothetical protein